MLRKIYGSIIRALTPRYPYLASKILYFRGMRRFPNLREPVLFSEKLMKLKLENYSKNPLVWKCADKFWMREHVIGKGIPAKHLPTLLGVYSDANDIDFSQLPQRFALKCTHGAGFNIICTNKSSLDFTEAKKKLNTWLKTSYGLRSAETHYNKVRPKIICEKFIQADHDDALPVDYKIYCFNGKPQYILGCSERVDKGSKVEMFDLEWNRTNFIKPKFSPSEPMNAPSCLQKMIEIAKKVSSDFPFVRVDFYVEEGIPVIGELTFTPRGCVNDNMTKEGQQVLGEKLIVK